MVKKRPFGVKAQLLLVLATNGYALLLFWLLLFWGFAWHATLTPFLTSKFLCIVENNEPRLLTTQFLNPFRNAVPFRGQFI